MHNAIPTTYSGVRFRSRLEARWSVFFDLVGWTWHYEPIDLAGYIPDFIVEHAVFTEDWPSSGGADGWIVGYGGPQTIGVGRTIRRLVEVKPEIDIVDLVQHGGKIDASGWDGPASIVGAVVHDDGPVGGASLGVFRDPNRTGDSMYDWGGSWVFADRNFAFDAWAEAGNRVQWRRPPGPRRHFSPGTE